MGAKRLGPKIPGILQVHTEEVVSMKLTIVKHVVIASVAGAALLLGTTGTGRAQGPGPQEGQSQQKKDDKNERQKAKQRKQAEQRQQQIALEEQRRVDQHQRQNAEQLQRMQRQDQQQLQQRQVEQQTQQRLAQQNDRVTQQRQQEQERQQQLVQQQRRNQYEQQRQWQDRQAVQRAQVLQQQQRQAQLRFQQQYLERVRQNQSLLNAGSYQYSAPSYRYSRGGRSYQTNKYGADMLRQAVNHGYEQGVRAGQADREDRARFGYKDSYAYQDATYGYGGYDVDFGEYRYYFREGFNRGYQDGYYSRSQYGSNSNGVVSLLNSILLQVFDARSY